MSMAERKTMTRAVKNPVKRKLTRAEKKEIAAVIQAAKGDGKPHTAQQTIPYLQMYPDGICRVTEKKYSKSLVFEDINYQLAQADDKTAIFENWCDFLNYFDASVSVQLSFINQGARKEKAQAAIEIPAQDDAFNSIRREYADMLKNQLEKGNNGLEKCKYITFSIEADNLAAAKARLSRIETDVLNNFKVLSILDARFDEQFGFTDGEVKKLLADYGFSSYFAEVKEWYNGYHFGNADIYCPWDVINYVDQLKYDQTAIPQDYWSNSSGNAIVRSLIDKADIQTKNEIERLIAGEYIEKEISQELTYDEIDNKIENLWSVLFTTGYLTQHGRTENGKYRLTIPNKEIRNLFTRQIREWFRDVSQKDGEKLNVFCNAFVEKNPDKIEQIFSDYLWNTISIRDTAVSKERKENFYHGILLGLLGYKTTWLTKSNAESGTGYSDILVEVPDNRTGIVVELKYAEDGDMETACAKALTQIDEKNYIMKLKQDGMRNFIKYGIACYKKDCKVVLGE